MKERLTTLALAAGALLLFYALIFPKPQGPRISDGQPLSTDRRPYGYLAIWRWLGAERIPRVSLRRRYARLSGLLSRPDGNVLLVTLPQRIPMRPAGLAYLKHWVAQGNTVLIAAALDDTPLWAADMREGAELDDLERLTGLRFTPQAITSALRALTVRHPKITPSSPSPLLRGVGALQPTSALPSRLWRAHQSGATTPLVLAAFARRKVPALWLVPLGSGQIILTAVASPFSNAGLALGGNARFLANVLAWSRGPGGAVIFDDAHAGLAAVYDAAAFFADARLHATLGCLVLLWLVFVLGSQPLRAAPSRWQPLDESAYIEGSARYLAAVVPPADVARRLIEQFIAQLRERMPQADPWRWLAAESGVAARDYHALERFRALAHTGAHLDLMQLQTLLARLRKQLT